MTYLSNELVNTFLFGQLLTMTIVVEQVLRIRVVNEYMFRIPNLVNEYAQKF
jgi:hypothetical protein